MTETQVSVFIFHKEQLCSKGCDCGGGYRSVTADIYVDSQADEYTQGVALIHEILGVYLGSIVSPETLTEIAEHILDGLGAIDD